MMFLEMRNFSQSFNRPHLTATMLSPTFLPASVPLRGEGQGWLGGGGVVAGGPNGYHSSFEAFRQRSRLKISDV